MSADETVTTSVSRRELIGVLDRLVAAMLTNDPGRVAALYSEDCELVDPYTSSVGRPAFLEAVSYFFAAFAVRAVEVLEVLVEGDRMAVWWRWTAVHQGRYLDVDPSGSEFSTVTTMWLTVRDGQIGRDMSVWDAGEYLRLRDGRPS
jgi:uncharacterized protein (TIGR02246 family)